MTKLYAIKDTQTGEFWMSPRGKVVWGGRGHAANAWNVHQPRRSLKFSEQSRYVVVEVKIVEVE